MSILPSERILSAISAVHAPRGTAHFNSRLADTETGAFFHLDVAMGSERFCDEAEVFATRVVDLVTQVQGFVDRVAEDVVSKGEAEDILSVVMYRVCPVEAMASNFAGSKIPPWGTTILSLHGRQHDTELCETELVAEDLARFRDLIDDKEGALASMQSYLLGRREEAKELNQKIYRLALEMRVSDRQTRSAGTKRGLIYLFNKPTPLVVGPEQVKTEQVDSPVYFAWVTDKWNDYIDETSMILEPEAARVAEMTHRECVAGDSTYVCRAEALGILAVTCHVIFPASEYARVLHRGYLSRRTPLAITNCLMDSMTGHELNQITHLSDVDLFRTLQFPGWQKTLDVPSTQTYLFNLRGCAQDRFAAIRQVLAQFNGLEAMNLDPMDYL